MSEIKSNLEGPRALIEHITRYEEILGSVFGAIQSEDLEALRVSVATLNEHQESLSMKDPYLVEVSHDLRSPLSVLVQVLEIMKIPEQAERSAYWFEVLRSRHPAILENIDTVKRSVNDPSSCSAVRVGANVRSLQEVFAEQVLGLCTQDLGEGRFKSRERTVYVSVKETHLIAFSNWPVLTRAILNLLANTVHHNPDGELEVLLSVKRSTDLSKIEVHVMDTGKGIDDPEKAFERGWTTGAERGNSGLGLYIVRSTLENVGAQIELRGHGGPQGGAHFIIRMPKHQPNQ